jgi:hydrogen peroxide-dependent heme synthase
VQRFCAAIPYAVGHLDRVVRLEAALPANIAPVNDEPVAYTLYGAFAAAGGDRALPEEERAEAAAAAGDALESSDAEVRGVYTVTGYRADADLLLWLVGPTADALQDALIAFRRTRLGLALDPFWSAIGVHREAEFAKDHTPAFYRGEPPRGYVCVYPFVRSYEWYLLPPRDRAEMLAEHGRMARDYPQVQANTVSAFALGDYEWLLAFEADELPPIVDLMRHLRAAEARRHTRHELPFLTGRRRSLAEAVGDLPSA